MSWINLQGDKVLFEGMSQKNGVLTIKKPIFSAFCDVSLTQYQTKYERVFITHTIFITLDYT